MPAVKIRKYDGTEFGNDKVDLNPGTFPVISFKGKKGDPQKPARQREILYRQLKLAYKNYTGISINLGKPLYAAGSTNLALFVLAPGVD